MDIAIFDAVLNWINRWGLPLVLLVGIIWWLKQKADDVWKKFVLHGEEESFVQSVIARHMEKLSDLDSQIGDIMYKVLSELDAQWCTLWQYHNGDYTLSGFPFLRTSATHQKFLPAKERWAQNYLRLPISLLFPSNLILPGCNPIEKEQWDDLGISNIMKYNGIETMWICKIVDAKGTHIANLTACWDHKVEYDETKCKILYDYSSRVQAILEVMNMIPKSREEFKTI